MNYVFEKRLHEGRWITDDGKIAAFAWDNTVCNMIEPSKRDIRWHVLAEPTDIEWGLVVRPTTIKGRARTFAEAKLRMAAALKLSNDLFDCA